MINNMSNLYKSDEWQSIHPLDRAQLLLVIEGLKQGTIISGNLTSFMDILKKTGLDYELNTNKYQLNPVVVVAKTEVLQESRLRKFNLPFNATLDDYHRNNGWLLGYPSCCIEEYVAERTPEQIMNAKKGIHHLTYKFGEELDNLIRTEGKYPDIFDYVPPSFTPCSIDCPEAKEKLTSWKNAIDTLDSEAAEILTFFNKRHKPNSYVHQEYLQKVFSEDSLEYKMHLLGKE